MSRWRKTISCTLSKLKRKSVKLPADKIDKVVSTKDEKTVNDKSEERLSKLEKNVYGKIE